MTTDNKTICLEYIGNQIQAFLVNRLAQAPATTAQLVGTFSLLVDSLSISENSLVHALDALYKKKVVTFENRNGNRLYSLVNFDDDYIFELNIDKVEELIAEYKLPYFSDHRKNVEEPLYFEARKNRTCIYINAPLPVKLPEVKAEIEPISEEINPVEDSENTSKIQSIESNSVDESSNATTLNLEGEYEDNTTNSTEISEKNLDKSEDNFVESEILDSVSIDGDDSTNYENPEKAYLDIFNDLKNDFQSTDADGQSQQPATDSNIAEQDDANELNSSTLLSLETAVSSDDNEENIEQIEVKNEEYKTDFDSIDFSSYDTFLQSTTYSDNTLHSSDSIDLIDQLFGKALAEASGTVTQSSAENETSVEENSSIDENLNHEAFSENKTLSNDFFDDNSIPEDNSTTNEEVFPENNYQGTQHITEQTFADDIVFTEVQLETPPPLTKEEQLEKMERAMRVFEEYAETNSSKNSEENASDNEENFEENEEPYFDPTTIQTEVQTVRPVPEVERDPEFEMLKKYISEEERINSYDWEKRLVRAFVDVNNDVEEEETKKFEPSLTATYSELKSLMAKKNYVFKAYPSHESKSFYSENYVFTNRLAKDTSIYTYIFMVIEILLAYFLVDPKIGKGFPFYLISGVVLLIVPLLFIARYYLFRDRRKPANFVFRLSLVTALMIYVNLMVMVVLVAFFVPSLNVNVNDLSTMILTIFYPAVLFLNIPISVCIYSILYHSKKYHLH